MIASVSKRKLEAKAARWPLLKGQSVVSARQCGPRRRPPSGSSRPFGMRAEHLRVLPCALLLLAASRVRADAWYSAGVAASLPLGYGWNEAAAY